jgi:hypothetical protein
VLQNLNTTMELQSRADTIFTDKYDISSQFCYLSVINKGYSMEFISRVRQDF